MDQNIDIGRLEILMQSMDGSFHTIGSSYEAGDKQTMADHVRNMLRLTQELQQVMAGLYAELERLSAIAPGTSDPDRIAALRQAFVFAAKYKAALTDSVHSVEDANKVADQMVQIGQTLDTIDSGRQQALTGLLDDTDVNVRAAAGAYLWKLMPDRVLPLLRQIVDTRPATTDAWNTAYWSLALQMQEQRTTEG